MADFSGHIQPLVSVMMPVYNGEKTILLAISSLFKQTYKNWLCIIVNDGSTDGTRGILDKITDNRFKIIHLSENVGRGAARQIALDNSEGEYLAYLDADDFYHPMKLEKQVKYMEFNPDVALVSCGQGSFNEHYELKAVRGKGSNKKNQYNPYKGVKGSYAGSMIRLSKGNMIRYNIKLSACEDRDFFNRYLGSGLLCVSDEVLYYYFELGVSSSKKILSYQFEALKNDIFSLRSSLRYSLLNILIRTTKIIIYIFALPILGSDFIIKRRGGKPLPIELSEFQKTLNIIRKNINYTKTDI
jgi:glycosyltransferase involved in cell wall biosynthesis